MFIIVETFENSGKTYTVVPKNWEMQNQLFWPSHLKESDLKKIVKNPESIPEEDWTTMPCSVKAATNSYLEARKIEKLYVSFEDTEAEERFIDQQQCKKRYRKTNSSKYENIDFNEEMKEITSYKILNIINEGEGNNNCEANTVPIIDDAVSADDESKRYKEAEKLDPINMDSVGGIENSINNSRIVVLSEPFSSETVLPTSPGIEVAFNKISDELCTVQVKLDRILRHLSIKENDNTSQWSNEIIYTKDYTFPLDNSGIIEKLNNSLLCKEFKTEMIERLSTLGGTGKVSDGCKVMYKIVDFMFTPNILNQYSWTGSSKSTSKKECFQKMVNIVDLLFEVIYLADCRHSRQRNEEFLKEKILKHTAQRLKRKSKSNNEINSITSKEAEQILK